ncbi:MAG: hypothetical protein V3W20_10575 [Candidatus Neomarinimicrobiota bacterium]
MKNTEHELHVEKINAAIDSIIELEKYYQQMPNDLSKALTNLNHLRNLAEEEIEEGENLISEKELDQIKEIRELMNENLLNIRTQGTFFNGKEITIETTALYGGTFEPTIVINIEDFKEYNPLVLSKGVCFKDSTEKNFLYAYIDEVGKFTVQKERGLLDGLFNCFKGNNIFGS